MSATDRTLNLRFLVLAAFLLAAGLMSLRAYDLFRMAQSDPVGSAIEHELTYLLEPITGTQKVRVSVSEDRPRTVLIMIDGDAAENLRPMRARIETILAPAISFDPEQDTLSLSQFPFARGVGTRLTPLQLTELAGLGVLCLLLGGALLVPQNTGTRQLERAETDAPEPLIETPSRRVGRIEPPRPEHATAATLAEAKPNETARLVRDWMSYAED